MKFLILIIVTFCMVHENYAGTVRDVLEGEKLVQEVWERLKDRFNMGCVQDDQYGCHKGYCWSNCAGAAPSSIVGLFAKDWCYTTRGRSQDYNYVRCHSKSDCSPCWKCAGSCTV